MKKGIKIFLYCLGGLIVLILLLAIILPIVFKPQILQFAKGQINKRVEAQVDFDDLTISLFKSFPRLYVSLDHVSVVNREPFAGDTLVAFDRFAVAVNLKSLFDLSNVEVYSILLDAPVVNARKTPQGQVNWDIMKKDSVAEEAPAEVESKSGEQQSIGVALRKFEIRHGNLSYRDDSSRMEASANGLNFTLRGDLGLSRSKIDLSLLIERLRFVMGGVPYAPGLELGFDATVDADLENKKYQLVDNALRLNAFVLEFAGGVAMPGDSIVLDLTFATKKSDFKSLLSLVPAVFMKGFEQLRVDGTLQLAGTLKGVMHGDELPSATLGLQVDGGMVQYPDLPKRIEAIGIDLDVNFNGKNQDATTVGLKRFHAELGGNPIDVVAHVSTPMSDPNVRAKVGARVDLGSLKQVVPLDNMDLSGKLDLDVALSALLSWVQAKEYEKCTLDGHLNLQGVTANGVLSQPVEVEALELAFTPHVVKLNRLAAKAGKSDVLLTGGIENFLPYLMADGTLGGNLTLRSQLVDLNELFPPAEGDEQAAPAPEAQPKADTVAGDGAPVDMTPLRRINFAFDSKIEQLYFQKMDMRQVVGNFALFGSRLALNDISCNMLGGAARIKGQLDFTNDKMYPADLDVSLQNIDVREGVTTFTTVEKILPTVKYMRGSVSLDLLASTLLLPSFAPDLKTIQAKGSVKTSELQIEGAPLFTKLGAIFKDDNLAKPTLSGTEIPFEIKDGAIEFEPFKADIKGVSSEIWGRVGLDQNIDMNLLMNVPTSLLGKAGGAANDLLSQLSPALKLDKVGVAVRATGPATDPTITFDLASAQRDMVEEAVKQKVEEVKAQVKEKVGAEAEKLLAEARAQGDRLVAEASKAAEKVREEARKQADNLRSEGKKKGPIAALAADRAAEKLVSTADEKADKIVQEARSQADALLAKAQAEVDKLK